MLGLSLGQGGDGRSKDLFLIVRVGERVWYGSIVEQHRGDTVLEVVRQGCRLRQELLEQVVLHPRLHGGRIRRRLTYADRAPAIGYSVSSEFGVTTWERGLARRSTAGRGAPGQSNRGFTPLKALAH